MQRVIIEYEITTPPAFRRSEKVLERAYTSLCTFGPYNVSIKIAVLSAGDVELG